MLFASMFATASVAMGNLPTREIAPGVHMPIVSIGTWKSSSGLDAYDIVNKWLNNSYRGIDTALVYFDQQRVAQAIADSGLSREDVFLTSKIPGCQGSFLTKSAVEYDLHRLNTTYIDLMLMHSPFGVGCASTWSALEDLVRARKLRAIGISNFGPSDVEKLCAHGACTIPPAVNQIGTQRQIGLGA
jgi:diketogulonate reductase-like aldo/keto reductase